LKPFKLKTFFFQKFPPYWKWIKIKDTAQNQKIIETFFVWNFQFFYGQKITKDFFCIKWGVLFKHDFVTILTNVTIIKHCCQNTSVTIFLIFFVQVYKNVTSALRQSFTFWIKNSQFFIQKFNLFQKNLIVFSKIFSFSQKFSVFLKNFQFFSKIFVFLKKFRFFLKNFIFSQKFHFFSEISFFLKNFHFFLKILIFFSTFYKILLKFNISKSDIRFNYLYWNRKQTKMVVMTHLKF